MSDNKRYIQNDWDCIYDKKIIFYEKRKKQKKKDVNSENANSKIIIKVNISNQWTHFYLENV